MFFINIKDCQKKRLPSINFQFTQLNYENVIENFTS